MELYWNTMRAVLRMMMMMMMMMMGYYQTPAALDFKNILFILNGVAILQLSSVEHLTHKNSVIDPFQ